MAELVEPMDEREASKLKLEFPALVLVDGKSMGNPSEVDTRGG